MWLAGHVSRFLLHSHAALFGLLVTVAVRDQVCALAACGVSGIVGVSGGAGLAGFGLVHFDLLDQLMFVEHGLAQHFECNIRSVYSAMVVKVHKICVFLVSRKVRKERGGPR